MMKLVAIIIALIACIALIAFFNGPYKDFNNCTLDKNLDTGTCLNKLVPQIPQIKDASEISEACSNSSADCITNMGKKVVEERITDEIDRKY